MIRDLFLAIILAALSFLKKHNEADLIERRICRLQNQESTFTTKVAQVLSPYVASVAFVFFACPISGIMIVLIQR